MTWSNPFEERVSLENIFTEDDLFVLLPKFAIPVIEEFSNLLKMSGNSSDPVDMRARSFFLGLQRGNISRFNEKVFNDFRNKTFFLRFSTFAYNHRKIKFTFCKTFKS